MTSGWPSPADVVLGGDGEWHWTHPSRDVRWSISRLGLAVFTLTYGAAANGVPLRTKLGRERRFRSATAALRALRATSQRGP